MNPNNATGSNAGNISEEDPDFAKKIQKEVQTDLKKKVPLTNYTSKGNKVIGIVDMCNRKQVKSITAFPPIHNIGGDIMPYTIPRYIKLMSNFIKDENKLKKLEEELKAECPTGIAPNPGYETAIENSKKRGQQAIKYVVGTIDESDTFKTTKANSVLKNMFHLESFDLTDEEIEPFEEKSHGKLKNSFRIAANVKNGHMIKIVFDLNPKTVSQIGDHANQGGRNFQKDIEAKKNIQKTGNNNFSSRAKVLAIVDMDTGEKLNSVTTIGVIGSNSNTIRFKVPDKYVNEKLREEAHNFAAYPREVREHIASELNLGTPKDAITFTVGDVETVPSYKATTASNSLGQLYNNQWTKGRGYTGVEEITHGKAMNSQKHRNNAHPSTVLAAYEKEFAVIKKKMDGVSKSSNEAFFMQAAERYINKIKKKIEENKNEKFGQVVTDERYYKDFDSLREIISELRRDVERREAKNESFDILDESIDE